MIQKNKTKNFEATAVSWLAAVDPYRTGCHSNKLQNYKTTKVQKAQKVYL